MRGKILIIDDEERLRKLLSRIIGLEGFEVTEAPSLKSGMDALHHKDIDVILCDVKLPDGNGVEFVKTIKKKFPVTEVILLTAFGNISDGVQAIKNGAFDYITKANDNEKILPLLEQALQKVVFSKKNAVTIESQKEYNFSDIIGESPLLKQAIHLSQKIALTDTTVLLLGETGTGKEVFANAIHFAGKRSTRPFVAINCSAFPRDLLESELFGHKTGAFTGAMKDKKGLIEIAETGTLFLDEIGEMNIDLQAKLLRVLENGEYIKVGDSVVSKADVRIIAATNRKLENEIAAGNFRQDLFYRLNVFTIELCALRERRDDIKLLTKYFLDLLSKREGKDEVRISNEAVRLLKNYEWKGNIRELRNILERSMIIMEGNEILPEHLPYELQRQQSAMIDEFSLASVEKKHIHKILLHTNGNKTKSADILGIGLTTLYRKMDEYNIPK